MLKQTVFYELNFRIVRTLQRIFIRAHVTFVTYNPYHNRSFPRRIKSSLGLKVYGPVCLGPGQMLGSSDINQSIKLTGRSTFELIIPQLILRNFFADRPHQPDKDIPGWYTHRKESRSLFYEYRELEPHRPGRRELH